MGTTLSAHDRPQCAAGGLSVYNKQYELEPGRHRRFVYEFHEPTRGRPWAVVTLLQLTSDVPLPNMIARHQPRRPMDGQRRKRTLCAEYRGETTHEIFVTYDSPKSDCSLGATVSITSLTYGFGRPCDIATADTNQDDAALASQQWVATNLTFDSVTNKTNYPAAVDDFWKFIGGLAGDNGQSFQGQCAPVWCQGTHPKNARHRRHSGAPFTQPWNRPGAPATRILVNRDGRPTVNEKLNSADQMMRVHWL